MKSIALAVLALSLSVAACAQQAAPPAPETDDDQALTAKQKEMETLRLKIETRNRERHSQQVQGITGSATEAVEAFHSNGVKISLSYAPQDAHFVPTVWNWHIVPPDRADDPVNLTGPSVSFVAKRTGEYTASLTVNDKNGSQIIRVFHFRINPLVEWETR